MASNTKVLIVDDRPENLFSLEKILRKVDVEVIKANSGNEALTFTMKHHWTKAFRGVRRGSH